MADIAAGMADSLGGLATDQYSNQLHSIMNALSPLSVITDPLLEAAAPYAKTIDKMFVDTFGPMHPYVESFPLMKPHIAAICGIVYLAFVLTVAPIFSVTGFSIKLKPVMRIYNLAMVLLSGYMFTRGVMLAYQNHPGTVFCVPMAKGDAGHEMAQLVWIFTYSKVIEFLDTFFMVMEGRMRQVSFLHVYHHVSILSYWFVISWLAPGSDAYFSLAGNSLIHVMMYGYYFLSSLGYSPWWKYYITKAQIFQFMLFCVQSIYVGYIKTDKVCDFPNILSRGLLWYMISLISLFLHFLITDQRRRKKSKMAAKTKASLEKPKDQ